MKRFSRIFLGWLPLASSICIISLFIYVAIQQNYRQSLNDPQIQIVLDAKNTLENGGVPADVVPRTDLFDISKSLSPFVAVYDASGTVLEASGFVDGAPPQLPAGIFQYTKEHGQDRVTWQPNSQTRIALVVEYVPVGTGLFVASGRNMSEVESRIAMLTKIFFLTLVASLILSFCLYVAQDVWRNNF